MPNLKFISAIALALFPAMANAQLPVLTNLHVFSPINFSPGTNLDGANPNAGVLLVSNTLYGTTYGGGAYGWGTVYKINADGTGFTSLHSFDKNDGAEPQGELLLVSNVLYGTCSIGGPGNGGCIFTINLDGSGFQALDLGSFSTLSPELDLSDNQFYGTTTSGGIYAYGNAFQVQPDGSGLTDLFDFGNGSPILPAAGLTGTGGALYGVATSGGVDQVIYRLSGANVTVVHQFTNNENLQCRLVLSGNELYGMASQGGPNGYGYVFKCATDGSGFTNLYSFNSNDGANPRKGLTLVNGVLYGTTTQSASHSGTVFQINTDGTGFTILHNFAAFGIEGGFPLCYPFLSGNKLYGTTSFSGPNAGDTGTIFVITLPTVPTLDYQVIGGRLVLNWTASAYSLQSSTNVDGVYSTISGVTNSYTNVITGPQKFFRLIGN